MQGLPEGSRVVCMGAGVRLVTQRESLCRVVGFLFLPSTLWAVELISSFASVSLIIRALWLCWEG